jgi:fructokinase
MDVIMSDQFTVAGIGELLWDVFPNHKRLGGAPANFACHCQRLGARAFPVSAVGADSLGAEIIRALKEIGVDDAYVQTCDAVPTGTVQVTLSGQGKPSYEICEGVAWDQIRLTEELRASAPVLDAVCFGSLAQRAPVSRETIRTFLSCMRADALKIFDVNLRQAFFSKERIEQSLELATILKVSDEELPVLANFFTLQGDALAQLQQLLSKFSLDLIAYTRGPDGSVLVSPNQVDDARGLQVNAVDSVGAGDSFTAALCVGLLKGWPLEKVNLHANQVAAYVCSHWGATPVLPDHLVAM